jgi:hypothetical protein
MFGFTSNNTSSSGSSTSTSVSQPQLILLAVVGLFGVVVLIMAYYILVNKYGTTSSKKQLYGGSPLSSSRNRNDSTTDSQSVDNANKVKPTLSSPKSVGSTPAPVLSATNGPKQVFNIRNNIYEAADAPAVCAIFGAEVATIDQLQDAHSKGADWCNVGWTKEGLAAFPIQQQTWQKMQENEPDKRDDCGVPGINLVNNNPNMMYGVNCYGVKPEPRGSEKVMDNIMSDKDREMQQKISELRKNIENINVTPFNQDTWCYGSATGSSTSGSSASA